jgi:hypothetical protein
MLCYKYDANWLFTEAKEVKLAPNGDPLIPALSTTTPPPEGPGPWAWDETAGEWFGPSLEQAKAAKLAAIQAEKSRARDAGFLVGGVLFDSDAGASLAYLELENKLAADASYATSWKASDGVWVTMDAALYGQVKAAGTAHIAACFAWQAAREAEVAAAQTVAAVNAVSSVCPVS